VKNLVVILDGLGYDQLTHFSPPHLTEWGKEFGLVPLETLLAYSSGIYTALYTGSYPDENDFWTEFVRLDKPQAPWTSLFRLFPGKSLPRKLAYMAGRLAHISDRSVQENFVPPFLQKWFGRIPVHYDRLPPIDIQSPQVLSALFQQANRNLQYIQGEQLNPEIVNRCVWAAPDSDTIILCLAETDHAGHAFGPMSQTFGAALIDLDTRLDEMMLVLQRINPDLSFYIFSDHGMTSITQSFDVWSFLEDHGFYLGKDYLAFINSTIVSLWLEESTADNIQRCLNGSGYGRILTEHDQQNYRLKFRGQQHGDHFFVANEGVEFIPNFLSLAWKPNQGMHGYSPECSSTRAFLIGGKKLDFIPTNVVSLYKMLADLALR
jgi:hypothetical protein